MGGVRVKRRLEGARLILLRVGVRDEAYAELITAVEDSASAVCYLGVVYLKVYRRSELVKW